MSELERELTRIRGMVRRTPGGIEKQRLELLGAQLERIGEPPSPWADKMEALKAQLRLVEGGA